jgi:hypothetical protein
LGKARRVEFHTPSRGGPLRRTIAGMETDYMNIVAVIAVVLVGLFMVIKLKD